MQIHKLDFSKVNALSKRDITYQNSTQKFREFLNFLPDLDGLKKAMEERNKFPVDRHLLINTLKAQYKQIKATDAQMHNLEKLGKENTYTIITAHQPALLTGPLYYIYKIFSAINLSEKLKSTYPDFDFVPVFINGSEDHDFDEIKSLHLFHKIITWQHKEGGPTGRFDLYGLQEVINEVASVLGENNHSVKMLSTFRECLQQSSNYNEFVFRLINQLFEQYGLIVANMDDASLKQAFVPVMKEELLSGISEKLIKPTQEKIAQLGFHSQAFSREINLFYMKDGLRERIIKDGKLFRINNTTLTFSEVEILNELNIHPERFSPNVVMRPLYEEYIFPNIAYIGGGGELAYWLERKEQFKHFNVFFPALIRRDSVLILHKPQADNLNKFNFAIDDIFLTEEQIINKYLTENVDVEINLSTQHESLNKIFDSIKILANKVDKSLIDYVGAEHLKTNKLLEQIESRIKRSVKKNEEVSLNQLKNLKTKLFPENGLQERHDNFLQLYNSMGDEFFTILKENLDPLDKNFKVLVLDS